MAWQGPFRSHWRSFTNVHSVTKTYRDPNDSFLPEILPVYCAIRLFN
jgi:hypothetical protein